MLLAFLAIDLFEAEEAPVHREAGEIAHLTDPQRRLVGVRAHDVEVEVDGCGLVRSHREPEVAGGPLAEFGVAVPRDRAGVDGDLRIDASASELDEDRGVHRERHVQVMPVWSVSRPTWPRPPSGHRVGLRQVSLEVCCERLLAEACQELLVAEHVSAVPGKERP